MTDDLDQLKADYAKLRAVLRAIAYDNVDDIPLIQAIARQALESTSEDQTFPLSG